MERTYAVILWTEEDPVLYSTVRTSKIDYDRETLDISELVGRSFSVKYEKGRSEVGKVIAIGDINIALSSRAKMGQLAADKAQELSNLSFQEIEKDEVLMKIQKLGRKDAAKRKLDDEGFDKVVTSTASKKMKKEKKLQNMNRHTACVIDQLQLDQSESPSGDQNENSASHESIVKQDSASSEVAQTSLITVTILPSNFKSVLPDAASTFQSSDQSLSAHHLLDPESPNQNESVYESSNFECSFSEHGYERNDESESDSNNNMRELSSQNDALEKDESSEDTIKRLKAKLKYVTREKNKLKKQLDLVQSSNMQSSEQVDLGENIIVSKKTLDEIKSDYRFNPSKFLRAMMYKTGLFTLEEVAEASVTGQKSREGQRPPLNPTKFRVIKAHTIKVCKLQQKPDALIKFQNTIRDICTDARKVLKNRRILPNQD